MRKMLHLGMRGIVGRKFLVDVMLQKLGRWLRILGLPTEMPENEDDTKILEQTKQHKLTLLTRDEALVERAKRLKIKVFAIPKRETDTKKQLKLVIKKFRIKIKGFEKRTLCTKCGGKLELVGKQTVKGIIPPEIISRFDDFLMCNSCSQIYWKGSQWRKIKERLERMDEKVEKNVK